MTSLRMVDHGFAFKKILQGKKWVGRVVKHADGGYLGIIGKDSYHGATEDEAFYEVSARAMGYSSANELRSRNRAVRHQRNASRARAQHAMNEIMRGNFKPLDELFGFNKGDK